MKKSKLANLLAVPVFLFPTVVNSVNATPFNSYQESKKIKTKTVAASVIDFLLRNPKTADKMKSHERMALGIIGDLLKTQGQREHEIDYATAGRDQLTVNTTDGRQAQFVKDERGNMYLVFDGVIHPIAQEFINQARNVSSGGISSVINTNLPGYNLGALESRFNSNPKIDTSGFYKVPKGGEYLSDIAEFANTLKSNILIFSGRGAWVGGQYKVSNYRPLSSKKIWADKKKVRGGTKLYIVKEVYKNQISAIFSYKWHRDLNNNGALGFNEFNQIKRTFYDDEDINIGVKYQTEKGFKGNLKIKILEDNTGKLLINEKREIPLRGPVVDQKHISAGHLPIGVYLIHANLIHDYSSTASSKSERFEIVQNPSKIKK